MMKRRGGASVHPCIAGKAGFPYRLSTEGDTIRVTVELSGIREEGIHIDLEGKTLFISSAGRGRPNRMAISLPWASRLGTKRFRDGVLELLLGKPA